MSKKLPTGSELLRNVLKNHPSCREEISKLRHRQERFHDILHTQDFFARRIDIESGLKLWAYSRSQAMERHIDAAAFPTIVDQPLFGSSKTDLKPDYPFTFDKKAFDKSWQLTVHPVARQLSIIVGNINKLTVDCVIDSSRNCKSTNFSEESLAIRMAKLADDGMASDSRAVAETSISRSPTGLLTVSARAPLNVNDRSGYGKMLCAAFSVARESGAESVALPLIPFEGGGGSALKKCKLLLLSLTKLHSRGALQQRCTKKPIKILLCVADEKVRKAVMAAVDIMLIRRKELEYRGIRLSQKKFRSRVRKVRTAVDLSCVANLRKKLQRRLMKRDASTLKKVLSQKEWGNCPRVD